MLNQHGEDLAIAELGGQERGCVAATDLGARVSSVPEKAVSHHLVGAVGTSTSRFARNRSGNSMKVQTKEIKKRGVT